MRQLQTLISEQDNSANFISVEGYESRYVQRTDDYFIIYLSSQNGCNKACRFCHLTQTKQLDQDQASHDDYLEQARLVLEHWSITHQDTAQSLTRVHVNFMARGEPLTNPTLMVEHKKLFDELQSMIWDYTGVSKVKFKISTIVPDDVDKELLKNFTDPRAEFYYSMYSSCTKFRKRWLPKALDYNQALSLLKGKNVVVHYSLIKGENDSYFTGACIAMNMQFFGFTRVNIVRYNPYSSLQGKEPSAEKVYSYANYLKESFQLNVKVIPRVGLDVKASCGLFVLLKETKSHS